MLECQPEDESGKQFYWLYRSEVATPPEKPPQNRCFASDAHEAGKPWPKARLQLPFVARWPAPYLSNQYE